MGSLGLHKGINLDPDPLTEGGEFEAGHRLGHLDVAVTRTDVELDPAPLFTPLAHPFALLDPRPKAIVGILGILGVDVDGPEHDHVPLAGTRAGTVADVLDRDRLEADHAAGHAADHPPGQGHPVSALLQGHRGQGPNPGE